jgi:ATP-dependent exoDNAse (exonuclease V) beta subunit
MEYGQVVIPYTSFSMDRTRSNSMDIMITKDGKVGYSIRMQDDSEICNDLFDRNIESRERMREETRILYVAMTRAIHGFTWIVMPRATKKTWQELLKMEERA